MVLPISLWTALAYAGAALAAPTSNSIHRRAIVPHDSLNTIPQMVQTGVLGDAIIKFNPRLHIASGCEVYPAVNEAGDISGGLKPSGGATAKCRDRSKGQVYARIGKNTAGETGIMYAWYFPKDQLVQNVGTGAHRHDWEDVVIWIDDPETTDNPQVLGGGASGHGEFKITAGALPGGDSAQVEYFAQAPTNHELQFTDTPGTPLQIIDWDAMPEAMRLGLQDADFGSAIVPFKDGRFIGDLDKAALANA